MILLGTGNSEYVVLIVLFLLLLLAFLLNRRLFFTVLGRINKLILPTMFHKDLRKLNVLDKLVIAYRYWVTKNSL